MNEFRLVLFGMGLVVLAGVIVWGLGNRGGTSRLLTRLRGLVPRRNIVKDRRGQTEPALGDVSARVEAREKGPIDVGDLSGLASIPDLAGAQNARSVDTKDDCAKPTYRTVDGGIGAEDNLLLVINVMAPVNAPFVGQQLVQVMADCELYHGAMGLFHYFASRGGSPVLSVANVREPGTFDPENWDNFQTEGISVFMQLPGPVEGAVAFDLMLDVGAKLARDLGGELRDAGRSSLTVQGIAQMREQLVLHGALAPRGAALSNFQSPPHTAPDHGHRGP